MATRPVTAQDHARIAAAIRAAEDRTDGEIYCVLARSSGGYFFPAAFTATLAMLLVSLAVAFGVEARWLSLRLPHFVLAQMLAFACVYLVLWLVPALRIHLVPRGLRYRAAHATRSCVVGLTLFFAGRAVKHSFGPGGGRLKPI